MSGVVGLRGGGSGSGRGVSGSGNLTAATTIDRPFVGGDLQEARWRMALAATAPGTSRARGVSARRGYAYAYDGGIFGGGGGIFGGGDDHLCQVDCCLILCFMLYVAVSHRTQGRLTCLKGKAPPTMLNSIGKASSALLPSRVTTALVPPPSSRPALASLSSFARMARSRRSLA